jgi:hypothetical protein
VTSVSESLEHPVHLDVPESALRARRISQLVLNPPAMAVLWIYFAILPAHRVFGFGTVVTVVAHCVCLAAMLLVTVAGRRGRSVALGRRLRPRWPWAFLRAYRAWIPFWAILGLAFVAIILRTRALLGLLPVPIFLFAGFLWWQNRWWPRMVLMLACAAAGALPLLGSFGRHWSLDEVSLILFGCAATANVIDQWELRRLLREVEYEADGGPADAGAAR